eukprot:gene7248-14784_t
MKATKWVSMVTKSTKELLINVTIPTLSIKGSDAKFPVRRVYCVAQNYYDHCIEMGGNPDKESPFFFSKPADAVVDCLNPRSIVLPPHSKEVDWECELVVAIGKSGSFIAPETANDHIFGYAMGVDLTARDLQKQAKKLGRPWDLCKGFDDSGPVGQIVPKESFGEISKQKISLTVNGQIKQEANLDLMIWSVPHIISFLSNQVMLKAGDLIFTGTPKGIGALAVGDRVRAIGDGLPPCEFVISPRA